MDLVSTADELYGLTPSKFTSLRDARAADAQKAGDPELSKSIKQLRRPTISAWLANLLVRQRSQEISQLLEVGTAMRRAQSDLAANDMRALSEQRRQLVRALATEAKGLADELGQPVNDSSIQELEGTLEAALADSAASDSLQTGCLTKPLSYSGFGPVDLTDAVAAPPGHKVSDSGTAEKPSTKRPKASSPPPTGAERRQERRGQAEHSLRDAELASLRAEKLTQREEQRLTRAAEEKERLLRQVSNLEKQISVIRESLKRADDTHDEAHKAHEDAKRVAKNANARVVRARATLDRI
jgi:hypothetical protein